MRTVGEVPAQSGRWSCADIAVTSAVLAISKLRQCGPVPAGNRGGLAPGPQTHGRVSAGVDDLLAPEPADDAVQAPGKPPARVGQ
jgi:hypothetical protein